MDADGAAAPAQAVLPEAAGKEQGGPAGDASAERPSSGPRAKLTRLRIAGFKSFAEPVTVEILPGLTGIVGPNGCGKSNVVEALRWAMGESSARSMRGGEMDDLIFAGTALRPSRNAAEVTLTLEDALGLAPPPQQDAAELEITRTILRGEGSHYRVNGREVRGRDVATLFADIGSGARASAMVSQGRVAALIGAKPEERRQVLEEAAGIAGLRARRHEAELRLRAAEANLARAEDLRAQLLAQRQRLAEQAKEAARYRELSTLIRAAEAEWLGILAARAAAGVQAAEAAFAEARALTRAAEAEAERAAIAAFTAERAQEGPRRAEAEARALFERRRIEAERAAAEQARARAALAAAEQRLAQALRDLDHAARSEADAAEALARLAAERALLDEAESGLPDRLAAARAALAAAVASVRDAEAAAEEATRRAAAEAERARAITSERDAARSRLGRLREQRQRLAAERDRAAEGAVPPAAIAAARAATAEAEAALAAAREGLAAAESARAAAEAAEADARRRAAEAEAARARLRAEVQGLSDLLRARGNAAAEPVLDRITVPAGLEAALGAALGEGLELPLSEAAARHWKTLPPLDSPPPLPDGTTALSRLVEAPEALSRALSQIGLLGPGVDGAALQPALRPGQVLVAEDGALWRWDGQAAKPGAPSPGAVRLKQRNALRAAEARLDRAEAAASEARAAREAAEAALLAARRAEAEARNARRAAEARLSDARAEEARLAARAATVEGRLSALEPELARLAEEEREAEAACAAAEAAASALPDLAALRAAEAAARSALAAARRAEDSARAEVATLGAETDRIAARRVAIATEAEGWARRRAEAAARLADLAARRDSALAERDAAAEAPERDEAHAAAALAARAEAEAAWKAAESAREAAERAAREAAEARREAESRFAAAREAQLKADAARDAARSRAAEARARIAERLGEGAVLPIPDEPASEAAEERARRKAERLAREREQIGPVNLRAETELAEVEARLASLDAERDEVAGAIAKLRGSIGHLNREGRERLRASFERVDAEFRALFARLFGGGRAHLALVGSDDPLEAGLEIYAEPPGKKLSALSLLSGGEQALTALSLIFAVFRCHPAPVCVLDEVDAPLDDANVERLCDLLDAMVADSGTRFLVVTHHPLTMARMHRLYGVTMAERGVSRVLSVDLSQAVGMAERPPAR
jgi:chromosome segregation protein